MFEFGLYWYWMLVISFLLDVCIGFLIFLLYLCNFTKLIYLCLHSGLHNFIVLSVFYFSFHWNWMLYNCLCIIRFMCIILPDLLTYVPIISMTSIMVLHFFWYSNKTRNMLIILFKLGNTGYFFLALNILMENQCIFCSCFR